VSTHHVLFFNVLCNELKGKAHRHFLQGRAAADSFSLLDTGANTILHHLSTLVELYEVQVSGALYHAPLQHDAACHGANGQLFWPGRLEGLHRGDGR